VGRSRAGGPGRRRKRWAPPSPWFLSCEVGEAWGRDGIRGRHGSGIFVSTTTRCSCLLPHGWLRCRRAPLELLQVNGARATRPGPMAAPRFALAQIHSRSDAAVVHSSRPGAPPPPPRCATAEPGPRAAAAEVRSRGTRSARRRSHDSAVVVGRCHGNIDILPRCGSALISRPGGLLAS
jgi:hypothetical protein